MISLLNFIFESNILNHILLPSQSVRVEIYKNVMGEDNYKNCGNKTLKGNSKHAKELMRCYLGDDDELIINNTIKLLNELGVNEEDIYIDENNDKNISYDMYSEASGTYKSVKIFFKNDISLKNLKISKNQCLYIINTLGKIKKKELTPVNLSIADKVFNSIEEVKKELNKDNKYNANQYKNILDILLDSIVIPNKQKTLDDVLDLTITIQLKKLPKNDLDDSSLSNLFNDFGEIISGCYLLETLEGSHSLLYPGKSNLENVDFYIDYKLIDNEGNDKTSNVKILDPSTIEVSAKNDKGSGCSCVSFANAFIQRFNKTKENEDIYDIIKILANKEKGKSNSAIITTDCMLSKLILDKYESKIDSSLGLLKNGFKNAINLLITNDLISFDTYTVNVLNVNLLYKNDKEKLFSILKEYYSYLNYTSSAKFNIGENVNNSNLIESFETNSKIPEGCIIYPLRAKCIKFINEEYNDIISKFASQLMSYYQIYLKYNKKDNTLSFKLILMSNNGKWEILPSGSVGDPRLKATAIKKI